MPLDHFVPCVYLRNFYSPKLGRRFYCWRKSKNDRFVPKAEDVCRFRDHNTLPYLDNPRAVEDYIAPVEHCWNKSLNQFCTKTHDPTVILNICKMLSYILVCSPTMLRLGGENLVSNVQAVTDIADRAGLLPEIPSSITEQDVASLFEVEVDKKFPQAMGVLALHDLVNSFSNGSWLFIHNEFEECPFFTSDFPIVSLQSLHAPNSTMVFVLLPNLAVSISPGLMKTIENQPLFENFCCRRLRANRKQIFQLNGLFVRAADDMVFFRAEERWMKRCFEKNRNFRTQDIHVKIPTERGFIVGSRRVIGPYNFDE